MKYKSKLITVVLACILIGCSSDPSSTTYVRVRTAQKVDSLRVRPALYQKRGETGLKRTVYVRSLDNPNQFIEVGVLNAQD